MVPTRTIHELQNLHDRAPVFIDRTAAGAALAGMLEGYHGTTALVLAIPAGGVPVAAEVAMRLALPLDVAPVSKVLLPWTTEAGYGAVAFDGTVWLDHGAVKRFDLTPEQVEQGVAEARAKVERRMARLRKERIFPGLAARPVIIVDDGIAAGSTMRAAVTAVRGQHAVQIAVAVPTAHERALIALAEIADEIYCANVRGGPSFAVADAYDEWSDVSDADVELILERERNIKP